jgi:hypothetical protein
VPSLLDEHRAGGYTEFAPARGAGRTGHFDGTRAWPGDVRVYFSIVPAERVSRLTAAVSAAARALPEGERLHAAVLHTDTFI